MTYPMPVLQALIDETHRLGHKAGCHVYGGEGQKNAIIAGCDTIEHGFGLDQEQVNMMVQKGLYYDPTRRALHRALYGRQRQQEHRRQVQDQRRVHQGGRDGGRHHRASRSWRAAASTARTFPHGTQALEFEALVRARRHEPDAGDPVRNDRSTPRRSAGRTGSARSKRASLPTSSRFRAIRWRTSPSCSE